MPENGRSRSQGMPGRAGFRLRRRAGRPPATWVSTLVVMALALSLVGPWAILQPVAWLGMVANFAHQGPFYQAICKTFDGHHPCVLCKAIEAGKTKDHQHPQEGPQTGQELKLCFPPPPFSLVSSRVFLVPPGPLVSFGPRAEPPPTPPPRAGVEV